MNEAQKRWRCLSDVSAGRCERQDLARETRLWPDASYDIRPLTACESAPYGYTIRLRPRASLGRIYSLGIGRASHVQNPMQPHPAGPLAQALPGVPLSTMRQTEVEPLTKALRRTSVAEKILNPPPSQRGADRLRWFSW
jgi:hypothetical protein